MSSQEREELRKFMKDSQAEFERNRNAPPREFSAKDFDEACKALELREPMAPSPFRTPPNPHIKAANNHLREELTLGTIDENMKYYAEVDEYIKSRGLEDDKFPERLRDCFRKCYNELASNNESYYGDELFWEMIHRLTKNHAKYNGAIVALLVHYFASCEVFPWHPGEEEFTYGTADKAHLS